MEILSNIPNALINNIGFMALLFIVYECVKWMGNVKPSQLFIFTVFIQIISLVQFLVTIFSPQRFSLLLITSKITTVIISYNQNNSLQWLTLIGLIYVVIFIFFLARILYQFKYIYGLKKSANFSQSDYLTRIIPPAILMNIANVKIGISNQIDAPITFGWIQPIVLLPIAICNQLTTKEIETILIHELAHILRKDYLVNIIISLNQTLLFFNPFSFLLNKEMSLQREIACDSMVIKYHPKKMEYMNALLKIAEHVNSSIQKKSTLTMGIFGSQNELLKRIQYFNKIKINSRKQLFFKLGIGILFVGCVFLSTPTAISINETPTALIKNKTFKNANFAFAIPNKNSEKVLKHPKFKRVHKTINSDELKNESYATLVDQTMRWIKKHEPITKFATYQDEIENATYTIADKLLIRAIFSNYQLKRDLLNQQLAKASNLKEALDYLLKSDELEQIKQYEKWTKEFLQTHPKMSDTTLLEEPIIY